MNFIRDITTNIESTNVLSDDKNSSDFTGTVDFDSSILKATLSGSVY